MITTLASAKKFLAPLAEIGNGIARKGLHLCKLYFANCPDDTPIDYAELMAVAKKRALERDKL